MERLSTQERWQVWKGVVLQVFSVLLLLFVGYAMQVKWGMLGLALTELMFLTLAVVYVLVQKTPLKEVFPIRLPSIKDVLGTLVLWFGSVLIGMASLGLMMWIMPSAFEATTEGMSEILGSVNPFLTFLIAAVMPCICEEAIERGAVLSHFRTIKKDWVIVLIMGIFFGIFHLDPVRFLNTAILGAALTYVMVKKNNFILPMLFHFTNNAFSVIVSVFASNTYDAEALSEASQQAAASGSMTFAAYLVIGFTAPLMIVLAIWLLTGKKKEELTRDQFKAEQKKNSRRIVIAVITSAVMLFTGLCLMISNPAFKEQYAEAMEEYTVSMEQQ
ncbi:MAG: CPBP family intramembrane metalloprotease [Clostridiales bacterium]|nr:CPBP family intramembrane metalloprotease [Clostridiales bacterium]